MDFGTRASIIVVLLFGGVGLAGGAYIFEETRRFLSILSYIFGVGCVAGAVVLTFQMVDELARQESPRQVIAPEPVEAQSLALPPVAPASPSALRTPRPREAATVAFTAESLGKAMREHTDIRTRALYLNTWIKVSGSVFNVRLVEGKHPEITFISSEADRFFAVVMYFPSDWKDRALLLKRGDNITVTGYLSAIERFSVILDECEFASP